MLQILSNQALLTATAANFLAQGLKVLIPLIWSKELKMSRLFETGGMPSSHSAGIVALATSLGIDQGWDSPIFALAFVLAVFVIYDAAKIRKQSGEQAFVLNGLVKEVEDLVDKKLHTEALRTIIGHTVPQVMIGSLIGAGIAVLSYVLF